jgi:hypothetical protein
MVWVKSVSKGTKTANLVKFAQELIWDQFRDPVWNSKL